MRILPKQSKLHLSSWDAARRPDFFAGCFGMEMIDGKPRAALRGRFFGVS
jgi:hypothetical protein